MEQCVMCSKYIQDLDTANRLCRAEGGWVCENCIPTMEKYKEGKISLPELVQKMIKKELE